MSTKNILIIYKRYTKNISIKHTNTETIKDTGIKKYEYTRNNRDSRWTKMIKTAIQKDR